jgi:cytochrome P450 family 4
MIGFFLAGHETSSHTLAFTLMELAKNPQVQSKLYEEIKNVDLSTEDSVGIDQLAHLKYLDSTVKESQRMHPVVNALLRETITETEMLGYQIPAKFKVLVNIMGIHNSPLYYVDPERFNPERWTETLNPNAFLPFGMGSHQCIGMKLALIEIKILLIGLLQNFAVSMNPNHEPLRILTKITHKPENLRLTFHKR